MTFPATWKRLTAEPAAAYGKRTRDRPAHGGMDAGPFHVVVVGGGFSGVALAARLLRGATAISGSRCSRPAEKTVAVSHTVAERRALAEHTRRAVDLVGDDPDHFVRWSASRGLRVAPDAFAPRRSYGEYLETTLRFLASKHRAVRFTAQLGACVACVADVRRSTRLDVALRGGRRVSASAVVLATGHPPPADPLARWLPLGAERYLPDPWRHADIEQIGVADRVLMIGTGLTMVDVDLALARRGHSGRIDALSRHGLRASIQPASQVLPRDLRDAFLADSEPERIAVCAARGARCCGSGQRRSAGSPGTR